MKPFPFKAVLGVMAITLLIVFLLALAPFTNLGSRVLLSWAEGFLPVEIQYSGGSLLGELQLSSVHMETEAFSLEIRDARAKLELSCLLNSLLCLNDLYAENVEVNWDGGMWRSARVQASVSINSSQLVVDSLLTSGALLELREASEPSARSQDSSVSLPIELLVRHARLEEVSWNIYGSQYTHQAIEFSGQWVESLLTLKQVKVAVREFGQVELDGEITFSKDWPFQIHAITRWDGDQKLLNTLSEFFPEKQVRALSSAFSDVQLLSPWKLVAGGTLEEQSFSLDAALSGLGYEALKISLSGGHRAAQQQLILDRIELRDSSSASVLSGLAELTLGEINQWKLTVHSNRFRLPAINDKLSGQLEGRVDVSGSFANDVWSLTLSDIELQGDINDLPAQIEGQVSINQALVLADAHLQAQLNGASLRLNSRQKKAAGVDLNLSVMDLGLWLPESKGSLELTASLDKALSSAKVRGRVRDFQWKDIVFETGKFNGHVEFGESHNFKLTTEFSELTRNTIHLTTLNLQASGDDGQQLLHVESMGDIEASLSGQGDIAVGDEGGSGGLSLKGSLGSVGTLLAEGYELGGGIKVDLQASWSEDTQPRITGELQLIQPELLKDIGGDQVARLDWDRVSLSFDRNDAGLQLKAVGVKEGKNLLSMDMLLPALKEGALTGNLVVRQLDIQPFQAFVPELSQLEGVVNGEVALSGTGDNLLGHGSLELAGGSFSLLENPTEVESLQLRLLMQGDKANIEGGLSLGGGQLDITGMLGLLPEPYVELQLIGREETLLFPPSTQLQVSHNISLLATADFLNVTGDLTVHRGVLEHEQLPEGGVALSDDVIVVGYIGPRPAPFDLGMDVQVKIEDHFKVVGSVVDVTVGGDLHLLQERGRPLQLFGNLNVVGGELRAYRQHLLVKRGTVAFSGAPENPALDMRAERIINNENITVGLALRGTLEDPLLEVYSDPEMPRTETLSYLVRGRGLDVGAGADGTAFALSMGASLVNESGLFQKFDKVPGLNSVELSAEGADDDTTATVSGYIGNRIYLSYGIGLYEPINVLTARLYLKTRLWIEVVSSLENSLDLYYSFDIE